MKDLEKYYNLMAAVMLAQVNDKFFNCFVKEELSNEDKDVLFSNLDTVLQIKKRLRSVVNIIEEMESDEQNKE